MPYSQDEQKRILNDLLDQEKVSVYCGDHFYFGPVKDKPEIGPHSGCPKCWFVFYFHDIATTPPHLRQARLDELEETVHHVVEAVKTGNWDFKPLPHAEISIEKGN